MKRMLGTRLIFDIWIRIEHIQLKIHPTCKSLKKNSYKLDSVVDTICTVRFIIHLLEIVIYIWQMCLNNMSPAGTVEVMHNKIHL